MRRYVIHKLVSLGIVLAAIALSHYAFGVGLVQWQFALLFVVLLAYMHFFVGFYYQLKALAKRPEPAVQYAAFAVLFLVSALVTYGLLFFFNPLIAFYINIIYFLFHGLLNEQTLMQRQIGAKVPLITLLPLVIGAMSLFNASLFHPSIMFTSTFIYEESFADVLIALIRQVFDVTFVMYAIILGFAGAFLLNCYTLYRYPYRVPNLVSMAMLLGLAWLAYTYGPLAYVNVYLFVVGYHFVTWSVYFFDVNYLRGTRFLTGYLIVHALVVVPIAVTAVLHVRGIEVPVLAQLLHFDVYLFFGMAHITTSFLNDAWMQRLAFDVAKSIRLPS